MINTNILVHYTETKLVSRTKRTTGPKAVLWTQLPISDTNNISFHFHKYIKKQVENNRYTITRVQSIGYTTVTAHLYLILAVIHTYLYLTVTAG